MDGRQTMESTVRQCLGVARKQQSAIGTVRGGCDQVYFVIQAFILFYSFDSILFGLKQENICWILRKITLE